MSATGLGTLITTTVITIGEEGADPTLLSYTRDVTENVYRKVAEALQPSSQSIIIIPEWGLTQHSETTFEWQPYGEQF